MEIKYVEIPTNIQEALLLLKEYFHHDLGVDISISGDHIGVQQSFYHEDDTNKYIVLSKEFHYEYDDNDKVSIKEIQCKF